MNTDLSQTPNSSFSPPLRIDVALIPSNPLFSRIIEASQAVTKHFENRNIIDEHTFPPHASLYIGTIPSARLQTFEDLIQNTKITLKELSLKPSSLKPGSNGYISLNFEITAAMRRFHEAIIESAYRVRGVDYREDEARARRYAPQDQENFRKYGNIYVLEKFDLHASIAQVRPEQQQAAFALAHRIVGSADQCEVAQVQVCNIGMRSEKWETLKTLLFKS